MSRRVSFMNQLTQQQSTFRLGSKGRLSLAVSQSNLLAGMSELDLEDFNSSLGCPLELYEEATLSLVGGKALQCWRLQKYGFSVPKAFIVPTYVYSLHIEAAGVVDLIDEVFTSDLRNEDVRKKMEPKLAIIREKIMSTPVMEEVIENVETWVDEVKLRSGDKSASFAVRSSGSAEDLVGQSFAGQYDTFLYKSTVDDIVTSIKGCWSSMFKEHILDYVARPVFLEKNSDVYEPDAMNSPQMGVLIMEMVEATSAGVCFSQNLWGEKSEVMIEAVPGQGEGLVGGQVTPDRFVVNKYTGKMTYQSITPQEHKFVRSSNSDGIVKVTLDTPFEQPVLSKSNLKELNMVARSIEEFYNTPMDIEWAIDHKGKLMILQTRPITTGMSFLPPGEGFWTFDPTHFPRPLSKWMQETYSMEYGSNHSRRTGCLIKTINFRFVHQFAFSQPGFNPPSDELERAAKAYWEKKLYEDDYREFTDFFRPDCEVLLEELRNVNPSSLSFRSLKVYVARCFDLAVEFWRMHHTYTFPAMVVVGDFMNRMSSLTGKDAMETLALLEAASPESRGILNKKDPLLAKLYKLLKESKKATDLLKHKNAKWALDCLLHMPDEIGETMREVRTKYGYRLTGGYDLVVPTMIEEPSFFLSTLHLGTYEDYDMNKAEAKVRALADEWKNALPSEKHYEFEEVFDLGQRFFRMRDERGLQTDLSGIGLCRRGILEAGRRLAEQGVILEAHHLCAATKGEALSLMGGDLSSHLGRSNQGLVEIPTPVELKRRIDYIANADPNLIPRALGVPPKQPDPMGLPPNIRRTMAALDTGLLRGIWDEGQANVDAAILESTDKVKGLAASMGNIEGPCRMVLNDGDLRKVKKGDIVCTYSCSASFNCVIGLCGGIVTDYGGMLSHAAIVAREYGIPCIVGSQQATAKFKDGDIIKIDSSTGVVSLVDGGAPSAPGIRVSGIYMNKVG